VSHVRTRSVGSVLLVIIRLKLKVSSTEQAFSRGLEMVSKDLFVLFRLHNPINQVQISDPMCAAKQPQTIILSSCLTVPFIAKGLYRSLESLQTRFILLYLSTNGDSSVQRNFRHCSIVQSRRSLHHCTRIKRFLLLMNGFRICQ